MAMWDTTLYPRRRKILKKINFLIALLGLFLVMTGCSIKQDENKGDIVYTTEYPVNYLVNELYGDNATISSIYPVDCDIDNYTLTTKQINNYAKGDVFIYNGLTKEKEIAKDLINENSNLYIMDVASGLKLNNDITELWLSPNNYLMLAKNIKDGLTEKENNKFTIENIESKYKDFEERISLMDASLHSLGKAAKEKNSNVIVSANSTFKFLEAYGFEVIPLDEQLKDTKLDSIKTNFKDRKYKYILMLDTDKDTDIITDLINNYKAEKITVSSLTVSNVDYFNEMNSFIENLKKISTD